MKNGKSGRSVHRHKKLIAFTMALLLLITNLYGYMDGWFDVNAAEGDSTTVTILGGLAWNDEAQNNEQEFDFSQMTRPETASLDQIALYTYPVDHIEEAEAITLQDKDATRPNYVEYRITEGENLWTYQISNVAQEEGYTFYVQAKAQTNYVTPEQVQVSKTEGTAIEMVEIPMNLAFGTLTIHNDIKSNGGDTATFTYQINLGKKADAVTTSYKKITNVEGNSDKTVQIPIGLSYKVTESDNTYTIKYDENQTGVMTADGIQTVVTNLLNNTQVSLVKIWNDNKSGSIMTPEEWVEKCKLTFTINGETKELTEENKEELGITGTINTQVVKNNTGNWTLYYKIGDSKIFPSFTENGEEITYKIEEDAIDGYVASYTDDGALMNTKTTDFTASIVWSDASDKETSRPANVQIKLYRYKNNEKQGVEVDKLVSTDTLEGTTDDMIWEYSVPNLPLYSPEGDLYTYYAIETPIDEETYTTRYDNTLGTQGVITSECYAGGTIKNTMEANTTFDVTVKWNDIGSDPNERPEAYAYLYRYPINKGIGYAAPVVFKLTDGSSAVMYKVIPTNASVVSLDFEEELTVAGKQLQKYDDDGYRYIYFVKEVKPGTDYVKSYDNSGVDLHAIGVQETSDIQSSNAGAFDGGIINNTKNEDLDYVISKTWKTGAYQDASLNMSVHMRLERKTDTTEWQAVPSYSDVILNGFSAEVTTKSVIAKVPKYDEEGNLYSYRTIETKVVQSTPIVGEGGAISYEQTEYIPDANGRFTVNGELSTDNALTFEFDNGTNRLVQEFDYTVYKVWSPIPEDYDSSSVTIELYRESVSTALTKVPDSQVVMTSADESDGAQSKWVHVYTNLPRYDQEGYE